MFDPKVRVLLAVAFLLIGVVIMHLASEPANPVIVRYGSTPAKYDDNTSILLRCSSNPSRAGMIYAYLLKEDNCQGIDDIGYKNEYPEDIIILGFRKSDGITNLLIFSNADSTELAKRYDKHRNVSILSKLSK